MGFADDYVQVNERIAAFFDRYPDGSIVADPPSVVELGERVFIACTARVYRTADDPRPAQASAWEPFPGRTNFTKDSEAMNAETSAVGRAIALLGFEVKRSVATREDVQRRQPDPTHDRIVEQKKRLAEACGGDVDVAKSLWGDRTEPLSDDDLDELLTEARQRT